MFRATLIQRLSRCESARSKGFGAIEFGFGESQLTLALGHQGLSLRKFLLGLTDLGLGGANLCFQLGGIDSRDHFARCHHRPLIDQHLGGQQYS